MTRTVEAEIEALQSMTTAELAEQYQQLHGRPCRTRHRAYLIRKNAWRIQANAEGDLTERARRRAEEIADDREVRVMAPRCPTTIEPPQEGEAATISRRAPDADDPRLPAPGSAIVRQYQGRALWSTAKTSFLLQGWQADSTSGSAFRSGRGGSSDPSFA